MRVRTGLVIFAVCGVLLGCSATGPAPSAPPTSGTPTGSISTPSSPSPSAPPASEPTDRVEPVDLSALAKQDERILTSNVTHADPEAINFSSPCSKRLGLAKTEVQAARTVIYFLCGEVGPPDISPARIVTEDVSVQELIATFMAGPDQREQEAGFGAGSYGPGTPVTLAKIDGVLVIDFLAKVPSDFTAFPSGRMLLAATLQVPAGVDGISVLDQHVPGCVAADLCE